MQGKATFGGHPIHPTLIPFPIGFFVGALVCDIISHWGDATFWPRAAVVMIGFGIVGALLAAVFGLIDYLTIPMSREGKSWATWHMILNLVTVAIFVVAFLVRWGDATATLGYVLTVAGVVVLMIAGYLGGHLAYHFGMGVAETKSVSGLGGTSSAAG